MTKNNNKSVYIPSVEGSQLYSHMVRGQELELDKVSNMALFLFILLIITINYHM